MIKQNQQKAHKCSKTKHTGMGYCGMFQHSLHKNSKLFYLLFFCGK